MTGLWKGAEIVLVRQGGLLVVMATVALLVYRDRVVAWLNSVLDDRADAESISDFDDWREVLGK